MKKSILTTFALMVSFYSMTSYADYKCNIAVVDAEKPNHYKTVLVFNLESGQKTFLVKKDSSVVELSQVTTVQDYQDSIIASFNVSSDKRLNIAGFKMSVVGDSTSGITSKLMGVASSNEKSNLALLVDEGRLMLTCQ